MLFVQNKTKTEMGIHLIHRYIDFDPVISEISENIFI